MGRREYREEGREMAGDTSLQSALQLSQHFRLAKQTPRLGMAVPQTFGTVSPPKEQDLEERSTKNLVFSNVVCKEKRTCVVSSLDPSRTVTLSIDCVSKQRLMAFPA